jgi:hypothetical protein
LTFYGSRVELSAVDEGGHLAARHSSPAFALSGAR